MKPKKPKKPKKIKKIKTEQWQQASSDLWHEINRRRPEAIILQAREIIALAQHDLDLDTCNLILN